MSFKFKVDTLTTEQRRTVNIVRKNYGSNGYLGMLLGLMDELHPEPPRLLQQVLAGVMVITGPTPYDTHTDIEYLIREAIAVEKEKANLAKQ